jgi:hypothetical protein
MKTAHLGRRLGDWLGIVPEDDVPLMSSTDYVDIEHLDPRPPAAAPTGAAATIDAVSHIVPPAPAPPRYEPTVAATAPAPSAARAAVPAPEPGKTVRSFRDVVNQRRAEAQRRAEYPQAPPRW